MTKFPEQFDTESGGLPDDARDAFLDILYHTLLQIRAGADNRDLCNILADHTHNLPELLREQKPELLAHYCNSIPYFASRMKSIGQEVSAFKPAWEIIQQEYERIKFYLPPE